MTGAFLTGSKIILRGLRRDDLEPYRGWLADSDVTHYLESGWRPPSDADMEAIFAEGAASKDAVALVIAKRKGGRAIGIVGFYGIQWICRRAEFRILIGERGAWNKGYGTEAARLLLDYGFDRLNLETVFLGVNAENKGAIRSYEKAGFVHEGARRRYIYRNGRYYDAVLMGVLRDEWLARRKKK